MSDSYVVIGGGRATRGLDPEQLQAARGVTPGPFGIIGGGKRSGTGN